MVFPDTPQEGVCGQKSANGSFRGGDEEVCRVWEFCCLSIASFSFLFSSFFLFNEDFSFIDCIQIRGVTGQCTAVISALAACPSLCLCPSFTAQNLDPPTFHQCEIVKLTMRCRSPN